MLQWHKLTNSLTVRLSDNMEFYMVDQLVRPPTITKAVADTLREAILCGDLEQGEPLREVELSQSLNVARGTLREALRMLQEDGLVETISHRGTFVTKLSARKVREVYTMRELLEPYAVGLAMENDAYDEQEFADIAAVVRRLGECERRGDGFAMIKADVEFHYLICKPSDHWLLLDILKNLQYLTTLCVTNLKELDPDESPQEQLHGDILDAIQSGDSALAQERISKHLKEAKGPLLAAVIAAQAGAA